MDDYRDVNAEDLMLEQLAPGEEHAPVEPKRDDGYQQAKEQMAETFAKAVIEKQKKEQKWLGYLKDGLLSLALFGAIWLLFSITETFTGTPKVLHLIACIAPILVGIVPRVVRERLSLRDAASECKEHFIAAAVLLVAGIVMLVFSRIV